MAGERAAPPAAVVTAATRPLTAPERHVLRVLRRCESARMPPPTRRELARASGYSLGSVQSAVRALESRGYVVADPRSPRTLIGQWHALSIPDRVAVTTVLDPETPDTYAVDLATPSGWPWAVRRAPWWRRLVRRPAPRCPHCGQRPQEGS